MINKCNVDDKNFYVNELKDSENKKVHRENSNPVKSKGSISSLIQDYGNKITLLEKKNHDYIEIIQNYDSSNLHAKNILLHHGYDSNILDLTIDDQILYFIKEKEKWDSENFKEFEQEINKKNSKISQYESTIQKLENIIKNGNNSNSVRYKRLTSELKNEISNLKDIISKNNETIERKEKRIKTIEKSFKDNEKIHIIQIKKNINSISSFERKLEYDDKKINEMEKYKREIKDKIKSYDEMINDLKVDKKNMLEQLNEKNSENDNLEKLLEIESQKSIKLSKILADTNQSMNDYILKFNKTTSVIEDYETQILELKKTNIEYKTFNDKNGNIIDNLKQIITSNNVKSEQQQTENIQLKKIAQDLDDDKKLILKNSQVYQINQENIIKELFEKDRQNNDHISMLSQKSDVILELRKKYNKNKNVLTGNKKEIDKLQCIILKTEQDLKEQLYLKENLSQEVNRLNLIIEAKTSELSKNIEKQESIIKDFDILKCKKIKLESDLNSMKQIFKEKVKSLDVDNEKTKNENDELFNKLTYLNEKYKSVIEKNSILTTENLMKLKQFENTSFKNEFFSEIKQIYESQGKDNFEYRRNLSEIKLFLNNQSYYKKKIDNLTQKNQKINAKAETSKSVLYNVYFETRDNILLHEKCYTDEKKSLILENERLQIEMSELVNKMKTKNEKYTLLKKKINKKLKQARNDCTKYSITYEQVNKFKNQILNLKGQLSTKSNQLETAIRNIDKYEDILQMYKESKLATESQLDLTKNKLSHMEGNNILLNQEKSSCSERLAIIERQKLDLEQVLQKLII